jgi:hypothetical protein
MPSRTPASSVDTLYELVPLSAGSRCIRVLDVHPPSALAPNGGDLAGELRVVDLDATPIPEFTALSYVWGSMKDAAPSSTITCCTTPTMLQLTDSCFEALKHLRDVKRPLVIWVDAICINQGDDAEKTHQLPLIGQIYELASATYIWLGPHDESSSKAMLCLSTIGLLEHYFGTEDQ